MAGASPNSQTDCTSQHTRFLSLCLLASILSPHSCLSLVVSLMERCQEQLDFLWLSCSQVSAVLVGCCGTTVRGNTAGPNCDSSGMMVGACVSCRSLCELYKPNRIRWSKWKRTGNKAQAGLIGCMSLAAQGSTLYLNPMFYPCCGSQWLSSTVVKR